MRRDPIHKSRSLRNRLFTTVAWSTASTASSQIAAMVAGILIARVLGPSGFGELTILRSTVLLLGTLAATGLGVAATSHIARSRDNDPEYTGRVISLLQYLGWLSGVSLSLMVLFFSNSIAARVLHAPYLESSLQIACALLLANAISSVQVGIIAGLECFRALALITAAESILTLGLSVSGAQYFGLEGAIGGLALASLVGTGLRQAAIIRECRKAGLTTTSFRSAFGNASILWRTAIPASLISLTAQPVEWLLSLLLVRQMDGFTEMALLKAALSWGVVVQIIPMQIASSSRALLSNLAGTDSATKFKRFALTTSGLCLGFGVLLALPMGVLAKALMNFYGPTFAAGTPVLIIILIANVVSCATMIATEVFTACNRLWIQYMLRLVWGAATLVAGFFLVNGGAHGIAFAYAIGNCVFLVAQALSIMRLAIGTDRQPSLTYTK